MSEYYVDADKTKIEVILDTINQSFAQIWEDFGSDAVVRDAEGKAVKIIGRNSKTGQLEPDAQSTTSFADPYQRTNDSKWVIPVPNHTNTGNALEGLTYQDLDPVEWVKEQVVLESSTTVEQSDSSWYPDDII